MDAPRRERLRILFVCTSRSSFVRKDIELLSRHFDLKVIDFTFTRRKFVESLRSTQRLLKGILWADLTFSRFADTHALFAVLLSILFRKKSIVVVGGYEVSRVPEIGYGMLLTPLSALKVKIIFRCADKVLTVSDSLKTDVVRNLGVKGRNIQTVYNGHDPTFWKPSGGKENLVATVAYLSETRFKLKGIDTFIQVAKYLTDIKFVIIGPSANNSLVHMKATAPSNVEFVDFLSPGELLKWYQKAKVYCQLSMREGHPNALCEAMLCECLPVGTRVQGIQTVIGDTGAYVPYGDPRTTAEAVKKALQLNGGKKARDRIKNKFPLEKREKQLVAIIQDLMAKNL